MAKVCNVLKFTVSAGAMTSARPTMTNPHIMTTMPNHRNHSSLRLRKIMLFTPVKMMTAPVIESSIDPERVY